MSVKYTPLAEEILGLVGGPDNVTKVYHCVTRLRFSLKDDSKVDAKKIADLDDVAQTLTSGGVFQVVIGTHVKDVFEEVEKLITAAGVNLSDAVSAPEQKMNPVMKVIDFISSTFTPVIPAIAGAGMVSAVLSLLVFFDWVSPEDQTYAVIAFAANACFYFLPIFLAFSAARKLGTNPYLAAVVASMMLHPTWNAMVAAGEPVKLFELLPLTLTTYASSVIPILLIILVQSYVEKLLERVIPGPSRSWLFHCWYSSSWPRWRSQFLAPPEPSLAATSPTSSSGCLCTFLGLPLRSSAHYCPSW